MKKKNKRKYWEQALWSMPSRKPVELSVGVLCVGVNTRMCLRVLTHLHFSSFVVQKCLESVNVQSLITIIKLRK